MVYRVEILVAARQDLLSISRYIARHNPTRARSFAKELAGKTRPLGQFPEMGREVPEARETGCREIVHRDYRIFYRIDHAARTIEVLRFWHAARGRPDLGEVAK